MKSARGAAALPVAIFSKPRNREVAKVARPLVAWLRRQKIPVEFDISTAAALGVEPTVRARRYRLAVVLGGDGTMLSVARLLAEHATPLFAVNLGTLGFLAETPPDKALTGLKTVLAGRGCEQRRRLLQAAVWRDGKRVARFEALNEVHVSKAAPARIVNLAVTIGGQHVATYRADGVLVATPTGSTAYALSAGGPVLDPCMAALAVVPVCPHALQVRPLIVPDREPVRIRVGDHNGPALLTYDGQQGAQLEPGDIVECRASRHAVCLTAARPQPFFELLRSKLRWG